MKTKTKMLGVQVPLSLRREVEMLAAVHHMSMSALVRKILRDAITRREVTDVVQY
jgi:plasmid stability protein